MIKILAKLVGGALFYAPRKMIIDGKTIFNPPEDVLKEQGYKDIKTTEAPTVTTMTQKPVSTWTDQEDKIVQSLEIRPAQPDPSAVLQEIQVQAIIEQVKASDDKTLGIQCMALFPAYAQNKQHEVGEVATYPETGYPKECIQAYDGTVQQGRRSILRRSGNHGTAENQNIPCRGRHQQGHTTCLKRAST